MVGALALAIVLAPSAAIVLIVLTRKPALAAWLNLLASIVALAAAVPIPFIVGTDLHVYWGSYVGIDALGAWVTLCSSVVYLLASIYAVGYMRLLDQHERLPVFY